MATCVGNTCGVQGWGTPQPGDPSGSSLLAATPAFGGIDVTWTLPPTNPFAVAYTILYRGITDSFGSALQIAEVAGGFFYDKRDSDQRFYYWIRHVSVNGTIGDLIGPASAVARPLIEDVIEQITGRIDEGLLATLLRNKIGRLETIESALFQEVTDRENGETTLAEAMVDVQAGLATAHTFLLDQVESLTAADSALATQVSGLAATLEDSLAAAISEITVIVEEQAGQITALAEQIDQVVVTVGEDISGVRTETLAAIAEVADDVTGLAGQITTVQTELGDDIAAVQTYAATQIGATNSTVSGLSVNLASLVDTVDGVNSRIDALWVVQLTVNDLVGGFGLANNGETVEAGFDVDTFWVGRTNADKRKPFIIDDDVVYLDDAVIRSLVFSKLRDESGNFIVEDGKVKAEYFEVAALSADDITAGQLRGVNVTAGAFTTLGSYLQIDTTSGATSVTLHNAADFSSAGGTAYIFDTSNDRDVFTYTGKTGNTLTGVSGVLAHTAGATVVPWSSHNLAIDQRTNELRVFGERGSDGVIDELLTLGRLNTNNFNDGILDVGKRVAGFNRTAITGRAYNAPTIQLANESTSAATAIINNYGAGQALQINGVADSLGLVNVYNTGPGAAVTVANLGNGPALFCQGNETYAGLRIENLASSWPTNRARGQIQFGWHSYPASGSVPGGTYVPAHTEWEPAFTNSRGQWIWFFGGGVAA